MYRSGPGPSTVWIDVDAQKLSTWTLVLDAEGIPYEVVRRPDGWSLALANVDAQRSLAALTAYERENPPVVTDTEVSVPEGSTYAGVGMAILLVAFFLIAGLRDPAGYWFARGAAVAGLIRAGEVWRVVTALTLHVGTAHVVSNALSAALFVTAVCRTFGPGIGWWLVLLAGAGGNLANAYFHGVEHRSVGASTAIFGAVGILAATQLVRHRRVGSPWGGAWTPLVAGVALLALLGTAEATDVTAHLFGFIAGGLLGAVAGRFLRSMPGPVVQWVLVVGALAAVAGAWRLALY